MKDKPKFCTKCGYTLTTSTNFCANCGRKIDEMPEKEKPSISQEDFFKKYHGDKILDRISEILKSSEIGDEDILFSISKKIKKKKEIDADDIQYLMDCSEELDEKETELPTNKEKISRVESTLLGDDPSSFLYTKGTSGFYGKRNAGKRKITIAIIIPIMFILLVGIIMLSDDSDREIQLSDDSDREIQLSDDSDREIQQEFQTELMPSDDSDREIQQEFQTEDLPQSCDGIHAVRYDLYPNLDECLDAIVERITFACHVKSGGDWDETIGCVLDLTSSLDEQCQEAEEMGLLSVSYESCQWNQYYNVYKNLGDVCVKNEDKMQCLADIKIGK